MFVRFARGRFSRELRMYKIKKVAKVSPVREFWCARRTSLAGLCSSNFSTMPISVQPTFVLCFAASWKRSDPFVSLVNTRASEHAHTKTLLEIPTYLFSACFGLILHPHFRFSSKLLILRGSELSTKSASQTWSPCNSLWSALSSCGVPTTMDFQLSCATLLNLINYHGLSIIVCQTLKSTIKLVTTLRNSSRTNTCRNSYWTRIYTNLSLS